MKIEKNKYGLLVKGNLEYIKDNEAKFTNPLVTGMRPVIWYDNKRKSTSVHLFIDGKIYPGEQKDISLVILYPFIFKENLVKDNIFSIGRLESKIADFTIKEIIKYLDE